MADDIKDKIRERAKGYRSDDIQIIPAKPIADIHSDDASLRVCAYCRVSTDNAEQTTSYELQRNYYRDFILKHKNWVFVDIYADEGISGTSMRHREDFKRMIRDCELGKIDLILVKSISRFARNVIDCISIVRKLKNLNPPVRVLFETENIDTAKGDSEVMLELLAIFAQEESHTKHDIMEWSITQRFRKGNFMTPDLYGYRTDINKPDRYTIVEEEAEAVRLIYAMFITGYKPLMIAKVLNALGFRSNIDTENPVYNWTPRGIINIIDNERRCGMIIGRKTFTEDYLEHKSKVNNGEREQYKLMDHHDGIVSPEIYFYAKGLLEKLKESSYYGDSLQLMVIDSGALKGFVSAALRYTKFNYDDYINASKSALPSSKSANKQIRKGDISSFNLSGFDVVNSTIIGNSSQPMLCFNSKSIWFNINAVKTIDSDYVEILFDPNDSVIAVRKSGEVQLNSVHWRTINSQGKYKNTKVKSKGFLFMLFSEFGWRLDRHYKIRGHKREKDGETVLFFNISDLESEYYEDYTDENGVEMRRKIRIVNPDYATRFGLDFFEREHETKMRLLDLMKRWNIDSELKESEDTEDFIKESRKLVDGYIEKLLEKEEKYDGQQEG